MNANPSDVAGGPLGRVNAHLRDIADRVRAAAGDVAAIRTLIDRFSDVDPVTRLAVAQTIAVDAGGVPCEWVVAPNSDPERRMLYVHGGSWMSGSLAGYRQHAGRLAHATGTSVLAVDYRLAPEHAFPAGLDDCETVFGWMAGHGPAGQGGAGALFLAGDSAGGNLVLALAVRRAERGRSLPDAVVALSPATDLTWSGKSMRTRADVDPILRPDRLHLVTRAYLQGRAPLDDPEVSPLFAHLGELPPTLVQCGDAEVLLDDSRRFAERAMAAGAEVRLSVWPDMPHVFQMFAPFLPEADCALDEIGAFLAVR